MRGIEPFFFCNPKYKKEKKRRSQNILWQNHGGGWTAHVSLGVALVDGILLCYWQGECKWNDGLMMTDILQMTLMSAQKVY
jgi:hypothetical protein